MKQLKRRCRCCGKTFTQDEILTGINPFDETKTVHGCPECKSVNALDMACSVDGCSEIQTCGMPSEQGYMLLCGRHYRLFSDLGKRNDQT